MITRWHQNKTDQYEIVGNYQEVLLRGTHQQVLKEFRKYSQTCETRFAVVEILEPGKITIGRKLVALTDQQLAPNEPFDISNLFVGCRKGRK